ncbi:MAG: hypothetical protein NDI84_00435 [Steroidobacteraceae bacterium]|nr:hypothetical protein [Steroidobacteraceae bacterium]
MNGLGDSLSRSLGGDWCLGHTVTPGSPVVAALAALDKLHRGVVLVGATGKVQHMNRAATAMCARGTGLVVLRGCLEFTGRAIQQRFEQFLEQARDLDGGASLVLTVSGARQQETLRVLVSALDICVDGVADPAPPRYCVFIYEPDAGRRALPAKVLSQLYGLTPAEVRLVNALFIGRPLKDAASQVGITVNTAKSVLKSVFAKCSVGSQAELLQLLALGPRTL